MKKIIQKSMELAENLGLKYKPVGMTFADKKPEDSIGFKGKEKGCIAPLIFSASKGKTVAFDKDSMGYPCSAFYLGFADWIFPRIEYFLSNGPMPGRECERFVKSPKLAKEYVLSFKAEEKTKGVIVYKPIEIFPESEKPEFIILFADSDQMSALVFLLHHNNPVKRDIIETGFASACMSFFTFPLQYSRMKKQKAFWGLHDIAIRPSFPKEITSLAMPFEMYKEVLSTMDESFLITENWKKLLKRINNQK